MAPDKQQEPIAIVGSGCRFPGGANSPSALWKLLERPREVGVDIGPDRFNAAGFYHPDGSHHGTSNVLRSYLMQEDMRLFDAAFFNLSPNEADSMDPQQRLLLETVYEALEGGGHTLEGLRGSDTAVYVGTMSGDYNGQSNPLCYLPFFGHDIPNTSNRLADPGPQHDAQLLRNRDESVHHFESGLVLL